MWHVWWASVQTTKHSCSPRRRPRRSRSFQGSESHAPNPGSRQAATNHRAKMWPAIPSDSRTTTAAVSRQVKRKRIYPWMAIVTLAAAARHLRTRARSTASESLAARLELSSYLVAVPLERGWKRWTWQIHNRTRTMFYTVFYTFVVISFQVAIFTGESCVQLCCPWRSLKSISQPLILNLKDSSF